MGLTHKVGNAERELLMKAGLWAEFQRLREGYKAGGVLPVDARRKAYDECIAKLKMDGSAPGAAPVVVPKEMVGLAEEVKPQDVVKWIFANVGDKDVREVGAPSKGAWRWLQEINESDELRRDFYKLYVRLIPVGKEKGWIDDGRSCLGVVTHLLELKEQINDIMDERIDEEMDAGEVKGVSQDSAKAVGEEPVIQAGTPEKRVSGQTDGGGFTDTV